MNTSLFANLFTWALSLWALALCLPAGLLLLEVVAAVRHDRRRQAAPAPAQQPSPSTGEAAAAGDRLVVLIPAHDEELGLAQTLASVQAQLRPTDEILVVADNCSDATAAIARQAGATVTERQHATLRGKGYALDHGVRYLASAGATPPAAVIILDADCTLGLGALEALRQGAALHHRPVQALYLMRAPEGSPVAQRVAEFAWLVKNQVRPTGLLALGGPCQLMGTGMAFPWPLLANAPLATGHLAEDMQLGTDLAAAGHAPLFCPQANVYSVFPVGESAVRAQRQRWERGHLSVIFSQAPRLLWTALRARQSTLAVMAADLCIPPLASLVFALAATLVLALVPALAWQQWDVGLLAVAANLAVGLAIVLAWHRYGRSVVGVAEVAAVPCYVWGKLPLYLAALLGRSAGQWVRAERASAALKEQARKQP